MLLRQPRGEEAGVLSCFVFAQIHRETLKIPQTTSQRKRISLPGGEIILSGFTYHWSLSSILNKRCGLKVNRVDMTVLLIYFFCVSFPFATG